MLVNGTQDFSTQLRGHTAPEISFSIQVKI